jgi:hypothetical protein
MKPSFIERAIAELAQTVPNSIKRAQSQKYSEMIPQAGMLAGGIYGGPPGAGLGASGGELLRQYVEGEEIDPKEAAIQGAIGVGSEVVPPMMMKGLGKLGESLSGLLPKAEMAGVSKSAADEALQNAVMMSREKPDWMKVLKGGGETSAPVGAEDIGVYPVRDPNIKAPVKPPVEVEKPVDNYVQGLKEKLAQPSPQQNKVIPLREGMTEPIKQETKSWANEVYEDLINRYGTEKSVVSGKTMEDLLSEAQSSGKMYHFDRDTAPIPVPNFQTSGFKEVGERRLNLNPYEDPFQWADTRYQAGKRWLEKKQQMGEPVKINTSSDLIARDDYLELIPEGSEVNIMAPFNNDRLARRLFPGNPSRLRLESAFEKLSNAGVKVNFVEPTKESLIESIKTQMKYNGKKGSVDKYMRDHFGNTIDELIESDAITVKGGKPK